MKAFSLFVLGMSVCSSLFSGPSYPSWWLDRNVVETQPPAAPGEAGHDSEVWNAWVESNYAVANIGQLKWMTQMARDELAMKFSHLSEEKLNLLEFSPNPYSENTIEYHFNELNLVISQFEVSASVNNYAPINQGQLKHISSLLFNVLHVSEFNDWPDNFAFEDNQIYPWTLSNQDDKHFSPVNLGQLKWLFSWDVHDWASSTDSNNDGVPDWWESYYEWNLAGDARFLDLDNDSISSLLEYFLSGDPDVPHGAVSLEGDWDGDGINNINDADPMSQDHGEFTIVIISPISDL